MMNKRNNINSQAMYSHNIINHNLYQSFPPSFPPSFPTSLPPMLPPPPQAMQPMQPIQFDGVYPCYGQQEQEQEQLNHCYYESLHAHQPVEQCHSHNAHISNWSSFGNIPTITALNFNDYNMNNQCARMDIRHNNISNHSQYAIAMKQNMNNMNNNINDIIDPIPPAIDNAQTMQQNYSFCSELSNTTNEQCDDYNSNNNSNNNNHHHNTMPKPYRFNGYNTGYNEDDCSNNSLSSISHASPSLRSDNAIKTEIDSPNTMILNDNIKSNKKKPINKPFPCPECGNRYKYKSSMKLHFKVHTSEAKICTECGKKFPHAHKLRIHMRSHTGERPYKCDLCPKAFSDKSNLNRHKRLHTGEKPYQCEFCARRYSDSSALVDHRRRKHTKEKPYKCQFCNKTFAASSDLTSHLAVHSNVRPFECNQCHKRFKRRSDVHKHMKTHLPKVDKRKRNNL